MRRCPACENVVMLEYDDPESSLTIDSCPECFGLWFDGEELKRFLRSPGLSEKILEDEELEINSPPRQKEPRNCPSCEGGKMKASQMGSLILDYCLACRGVWFDHGELKKAIDNYESGERGNILILNQIAEGLRPAQRSKEALQALLSLLGDS